MQKNLLQDFRNDSKVLMTDVESVNVQSLKMDLSVPLKDVLLLVLK